MCAHMRRCIGMPVNARAVRGESLWGPERGPDRDYTGMYRGHTEMYLPSMFLYATVYLHIISLRRPV